MQQTDNNNTVLISMIGYTISMAFTVMVMVFLTVSWTGTKGITIIYWNYFGEHNIETLLFIAAFIVTIIGFHATYKNFQNSITKKNKMICRKI